MKTQIELYYSSMLSNSAALHEKMALLHEKHGNGKKAALSRRDATARRIASGNVDMGVSLALDYGQWAADQIAAGTA